VEQAAQDFISGFFDVEMVDEWDELRESLYTASPTYQEAVRHGLAELIRAGDLTREDYFVLTRASVDSPDEAYAKLRAGYEFLFGQPPGD
jgi:hypothetical protein